MWLLHHHYSELFAAGLIFSSTGMLFAAGGSFLTALLASVLPAWWASRISPLDAMNAHSAPTAVRPPILWAVAGAILASLDPFLFFGPVEQILKAAGFSDPSAAAETLRFFGHFVIGLPGITVGFFLMAPTLVWVLERILSPFLGHDSGIAHAASSPATQHRYLAHRRHRRGSHGWIGDPDRHAGAGPYPDRRVETSGQIPGHLHLEP